MSLKRIGSWGAAWGLVMLAGTLAFAQGLQDMQLFGHGDQGEYGGGQRANEGTFFTFDGLVMNISRPATASFGAGASAVPGNDFRWYGPGGVDSQLEYSSLNTSWLESTWSGGQRIEMGNVCEHQGWMLGYTRLHRSTQTIDRSGVHWLLDSTNDTSVAIDPVADHVNIVPLPGGPPTTIGRLWGNVLPGWDPTAWDFTDPTTWPTLGPLPVVFRKVHMWTTTSFQYVDAAYLYRMHPLQHGGVWEWSFGARWFEFEEDFGVQGSGGTLGNTYLNNHAWNELVGPQLGLRITHAHQGWTFSSMGSFTAAANMQSVRQNVVLGQGRDLSDPAARAGNPPQTFIPWNMQVLQQDHSFHDTVFSPLVEVRLEAKYQLTRAMSFKAGWNALWVDNIARPSNMVNYQITGTDILGINSANNKQSAFVNGLELGLEFNR